MLKFFAEKNVSSFCSAKATHIFSAKNIRILYSESAKTVNEMTLNELVKLTTLWTTRPRIIMARAVMCCKRLQRYSNILSPRYKICVLSLPAWLPLFITIGDFSKIFVRNSYSHIACLIVGLYTEINKHVIKDTLYIITFFRSDQSNLFLIIFKADWFLVYLVSFS